MTGAPYLASGRVYFEVEVLEAQGLVAAGFAGEGFLGARDDKVDIGDDARSWGVY